MYAVYAIPHTGCAPLSGRASPRFARLGWGNHRGTRSDPEKVNRAFKIRIPFKQKGVPLLSALLLDLDSYSG